MSSTPALLAGVLARLASRYTGQPRDPVPAAVVLDLDGTLIDNRPRSCAILHELAGQWQGVLPGVARRMAEARPEQLAYLFEDNLRACGVTDDQRMAEALAYWKARFFTDELLYHDRPTPGAVSFVHACRAAGANVVYFTARDLPNMGVGTFASLRQLGFPLTEAGVALVMKLDPARTDAAFKQQAAESLQRCGPILAAFDNEPGHCNLLQQAHGSADVFLLDTQHRPGAPRLDSRVRILTDFRTQ